MLPLRDDNEERATERERERERELERERAREREREREKEQKITFFPPPLPTHGVCELCIGLHLDLVPMPYTYMG